MTDWVAAISSSFSAIAAVFSLLAFVYVINIQREDSINDVRPELLLLDWSVEEKEDRVIGPYTRIHASRIKNVGRGPAFDLWCMEISPKQSEGELTSAVLSCPYVAAGTEEVIDVGFLINWSNGRTEEDKDSFIVRLLYSDLGRRRHWVDIHLVVAKKPNYGFHGAKQLAPKLFMAGRSTTVIEKDISAGIRGWFHRLRSWWRDVTVDRWQI